MFSFMRYGKPEPCKSALDPDPVANFGLALMNYWLHYTEALEAPDVPKVRLHFDYSAAANDRRAIRCW